MTNNGGYQAETGSWVIKAFSRPYNTYHDSYQLYYHEALRLHLKRTGGVFTRSSMTRFPQILKGLWKVRQVLKSLLHGIEWPLHMIDKVAIILEGPCVSSPSVFSPLVGQYLVADPTRKQHKILKMKE